MMRHFPYLLIALLIFGSSACSTGEGNVSLELDGVEGLEGLTVNSLMISLPMTQEALDLGQPFGLTADFLVIDDDPFSGVAAYEDEDGNVAEFESGMYRFIIEVYESSGPMYFGCEQSIEVEEGENVVITITELPTYTESGIHWTPYDELFYPECLSG